MSQWPDLLTLAEDVRSKKTTASDLVHKALSMIADKKQYQAIIATLDDAALKRAAEIDKNIVEGKTAGRLLGVPFIAKDNFLVYGGETTAASNILKGFVAPYQATAINRLEAEGAICVAKANLDAFAHGASTENSDFMVTKNPHDDSRVSGGSSGGSAAAVALEMVPFALGTDTGGSIRQPASFCGVVGYKPTYGLVSRSGVIAMASSTDVIGPLAKTVDDAALVFDIIAGVDPLDSTMIGREDRSYTELEGELKDARIGLVEEYMGEGVDQDIKDTIQKAIDVYRVQGANIKSVSLPSLTHSLAVYYIICPAEVSSNLSRYDGQRFGYSYPKANSLEESYIKSRSIGFGREAKRRIMIGTHVLSSGYYDAYYKKAQTVRTKLINEFNEIFKEVDYLVGPVTPTTAFKIGQNTQDPLNMYLADIMTVAANLTGIPAISIPAGMSQGLPVGIQLMAPQRKDRQLLALAKAAERVMA
ncbi:MAG TPA: Asp-tRNA(Asn)/Glu-tRNA(Gln) amidotransferase subunit GatA [Candidatus Saccharimonadales bacterium]|jgi:aspartyl-tRNA(Asn)/glutamyl-tRNA(Gln) amidotransferase subunit A|nr:Asp-tRNA(Asn)/Glu-tRNA(Gln) amidotransferase subunit GatA [Candidatus Saccharimonadales bacterium]